MKVSRINYTASKEKGLRFDAGFHLSEGVAVKRTIANTPYGLCTIGEVTNKIFYGIRASRKYVTNINYAIPFLTGSSILSNDFRNIKYVSKKYTPGIKEMSLEKGWILITRSGTVGQIAYSNDLFTGKYGSEDIIRVIPNGKIESGILYSYLASKYGQALLTQGTFGAVVQHIEPSQIEAIRIPLFPKDFQDKVSMLVSESARLREEASSELCRAEEIFMSANGINITSDLLDRPERKTALCRRISSSQVKISTFKALNYSTRANNIINILRTTNFVLLEDYLKVPFYMGARASFKRIDQNKNGESIISQSDIHRRNPKNFKKVAVKQESANCRARRGTLIMPSAGTLGENEVFTRPLLIRSNYEGKLLSEVIGVFECKSEKEAAYLQVFLSSLIGFRLMRTMASGTNLMYPMWSLLKEIPVPICDKTSFDNISELVLSAYDKNGLSNDLENQAISLVEQEIEKWNK